MNSPTEAQDTSLEKLQDSVTWKALQCLDILTVLFEICPGATLASSARVCTLWSIPALRLLWRELPSSLPLFQLLGMLDIHAYNASYEALNLHNLSRVQFYGQFIHSISVTTGLLERYISPRSMKEFTAAVQLLHAPLLPNMSTLECTTSHDAFMFIGMWLNSPLTNLKLTFNCLRRADCLPVIHSIRHHSTSLVSLTLELWGGETPLLNVWRCCADTLKSLSNLVRITAAWQIVFAPSVWGILAQLPKLEEVFSPRNPEETFSFEGELDRSVWSEPPILAAPFPSLHTLVAAIPCWLAAIILTKYRFGGLHCLELLLEDSPDNLCEGSSIAQGVLQHSNLTNLLLITPSWKFPVLELCPLFNMKRFYICTQDSCSLNDEDFSTLCIAMPNLEFFGLIPPHIGGVGSGRPQLTLKVIRSIADTCLHLKHAVLYVDTDLSSFQSCFDDEPFPSNHPLLSLCFPPTPVRDYVDVAACLSTLFADCARTLSIKTLEPSIQDDFEWGPSYSVKHSTDWRKIAGMVDTLTHRVLPSFKRRLEANESRMRN